MTSLLVNYPLSERKMIEDAFPFIIKEVFSGWEFPPQLSAQDWDIGDDENPEFQLRMDYHNPKDWNHEVIQKHEAMDLVQSFIEGMKYRQYLQSC